MKRWMSCLGAVLLAGCSAEPASYQIFGADVSLTVERTKSYFWSDGWDMSFVVRRNPECQRRYAMKSAGNNVKVEVYSPEPGVYILRQGKRWYVTELKSCGFEAYKEAPPEPGDLLGTFREKDGAFMFVENKDKAAAKAETE